MTTTTRISQEVADEIILNSDFEFILDGDCEITEDGYAYGLENGEAVVVGFDGRIYVPALDGGLLLYQEWLETDEAAEFETTRFTEACRAQQDAIEAEGGMNAYHNLGYFTEQPPAEWEFASEGDDQEPFGIDGLPMVFTAAHDWN